ncbi:ubiquitin fusion degradation protein UFD1 domain-containing protein [Sarocladium implicatum]|nr:ubiquitin fusion degradation protein UFD1 domain-containing protein [Sarocladium implicatum]
MAVTSADLKWQETFDVLPQTALSPNQLQGDKILLPQSALEELLSAASTLSTQAVLRNGDQVALPSPLTFRLTNIQTRKNFYAGILEFSAPAGTVAVSPLIFDALGLDKSSGSTDESVSRLPQISVQICHLSKGHYVRLRPLEAGYDVDDWKALLERQLRNGYTTLTNGSTLSVQGLRNDRFQFLVDKLTPDEPAVCVVDTDIEVDIEALDEEQARETLRRLVERNGTPSGHDTPAGGELSIWKPATGEVQLGSYVDYTLPSWDRSNPFTVSLTLVGGGDADALDLFVSPKSTRQRAAPRRNEHVFGSFAPAIDGVKSLLLDPSDTAMENAESLMISINGYKPIPDAQPRAIPFSVRIQPAADAVAQSSAASAPSADDTQCSNCLQWVPARSIMLHENFCLRNNIRCPQCDAVFKKGDPEFDNHWHCDLDSASGNSAESRRKHDDIFHTTRECSGCSFTTNSIPDLARHRTTVCPAKLILCRFCHLEVPQEGDPFNPSPEVVLSGLTAHELADGARTTNCHLCQKIVRLRDMDMHMKHHELDKTKREAPPTCRNINCGRTLHGVGPKGQVRSATPQGEEVRANLGLCAACFGPLYVSMHDPEGKALRRRIERRYLGQLMTGCGKGHCANEWCRTGRSNTGLEAKPSSAAGVLPLVKPLLAAAAGNDLPMYFCVDETSHKQRIAANMVAAEGVWDMEWALAAAESEGGDPSRMRDWLQAWAPTRYS